MPPFAAVLAAAIGLTQPALLMGNIQNNHSNIILPTAYAQSPSARNSQTKTGTLLVLAAQEEDSHKALAYLEQAKSELANENLPAENQQRILEIINALEAKINSRISSKSRSEQPGSKGQLSSGGLPAVVGLENAAANPTENPTTSPSHSSNGSEADIAKAINKNPEIQDALWELSQGQLQRNTTNLDAIVKSRTGMTPLDHDEEEAMMTALGNQPGTMLELLNRLNMLNLDVSRENLRLKREFDGVSIDILADKLIVDASKYAIPVGALQGVLADIGMTGRLVGISSDVLMTFVINANLALRLSDLYGIEMNNSEKEIILLVVFAAAKVAGQFGLKNTSTTSLLTSLGGRIGQLKYTLKPSEFIGFIKNLASQPAVVKAAGPIAAELATATSGLSSSSPDTKTTETKSTDPKKIKEGLIAKMASRINLVRLLKGTVHGARAAAETYIIGHAAKQIFKSAHASARQIHNDNFRRFLMTPAGEGFLKLLVLSTNDSSTISNLTASERLDLQKKSTYITNLARSAKACSNDDLKIMSSRVSSEMSSAGSKLSTYACRPNSNTARFERLQRELLTFDGIPTEYIADLRVAPLQQRYQMAEITLQLQFLDGDRSPSEVQFFRTTIAKTLGLESPEDIAFFDRMHSFVIERGGLEPSEFIPSGFRIRSGGQASPYDMREGYTPADAPYRPYDPQPKKTDVNP